MKKPIKNTIAGVILLLFSIGIFTLMQYSFNDEYISEKANSVNFIFNIVECLSLSIVAYLVIIAPWIKYFRAKHKE